MDLLYLNFNLTMKKHILFILLFLLPIVGFSQLTEKNKEVLREELAKRINDLRVSKGLKPLLFNDTLRKAAEFHSEYMAKNKILSHDEKSSKYATPKKRVEQFDGEIFEIVGENALSTTIQEFPLKKSDLILLAEQMFTSWKNSPGHYANMIEAKYMYGDLGFATYSNDKIVYATQVFGTKGYVVKNQLSKNTFRIAQAPDDCESVYQDYTNLIYNLGNDLRIEGNEINLYYHDLTYFNRIFTSYNDGIAIDLVARDQFPCGVSNQLDFSPVYDGIMLKPIYTAEMLQKNRAEGEYRLITKVGDIPIGLHGDRYSPSLILIKNGKACKYVFPAFVPRKTHNLISLKPILTDEPLIELRDFGVIESQLIDYDFKTDSSTAITSPSIAKKDYKIHSIQINSFSSVEGDSIHNKMLYNARAGFIKQNLISRLGVSDKIFAINAKENWDQMHFQLTYFKSDSLVNLSRESFRAYLTNRNDSLPWDSLFFSQRRASAIINYQGTYHAKDSIETLADFNLRTAVATGNVALANKAMYEMYTTLNYDWDYLYGNEIVEFVKTQPKVVANYAALLSLDYEYDPYFVTDFIDSWTSRSNKLDLNARNNLLYLYTLVGTYLLDNWDVSAERLSNVIHPNEIEKISFAQLSSELLLNLHLTFIQYYGQINDDLNVAKSFNFITNYFETHSLKEEDDVSLTLFYNNWSMYTMTINHLLPKFKLGKINEDGVFILAETMNFTNFNTNSVNYLEVQKKALSMNKIRWCDLLNYDFQVLRNEGIKKLYCEACK